MQIIKKIKLIDFKLTKSIWNLLFGLYKSKFHWSWINFSEHKEYVFWDPVKAIDWKTSSKTDKIYSKIFEEEKELKVLFLIDLNPSMFWKIAKQTKKEILEEVFYSLAFSSYKNSDSFWILFYWSEKQEFIPYKKDFWNILRTIDKIENSQRSWKIDNNRTKKIFENLVKNKIKDNLIFILSDDILQEDDKSLKILWLRNEVIFINIFDYFENNLENIWNDVVFASDNNFLDLSLSSKETEKFNILRKEKLENFKNILKKNKIWYIYLDTKKNIFKELFLYFSKL